MVFMSLLYSKKGAVNMIFYVIYRPLPEPEQVPFYRLRLQPN